MSLLKRLERERVETSEASIPVGDRMAFADPYRALKEQIHDELVETIDERLLNSGSKDGRTDALRESVQKVTSEFLQANATHLSSQEQERILKEVVDEVTGFGPITVLLNDPEVSEVMVNGANQIYVERGGRLMLTDIRFRDDEHVLHIIDKIVSPLGRRIDESSPMVDARLPDGSRVNAIIPPLSLMGPVITIRKFSKDPLSIDDLIQFDTLSEAMAVFLEACVRVRLNIVVSGGTGSGKTTTLNVLSSFIPSDERIVTIEDAAELQLMQDHVIPLETRPPNIEGKGAITMRDLVRNSLRMRPNRIVVGEVRGGEALDMLQAMNTGHDGSLTTGHANSPRDMLARLETMVLMAGMDLPIRAVREQISSALDLIVHQVRLRDGTRKISHITEVLGMEGDVITLQDIFLFEQIGIDDTGRVYGRFVSTGVRPSFTERFLSQGIQLPPGLFDGSYVKE
jgi:pilus assembly protein CpaF